MSEGKTQAALKILSIDYENRVLKIDDDILTELKSKHPHAAQVKKDSLLFGPINELSKKSLVETLGKCPPTVKKVFSPS